MSLGTPAILTPRLVDELRGEFFVPDYQRGYRWGKEEVRRLLDDIKAAEADNYYLQPIVVKPMDDGRYELVDGQQRLTTLYLVLRALQKYLPETEVGYRISYETRPGSADFLDQPREEEADSNIDYFHMFAAFQEIQAWFSEQAKPTLAAIELSTALSKSVFVIWYEAPQSVEFDSRALFTRLNVGRIPLTDAELVKASLLSRIERQHETAAQWDSIERDLWQPEVWAFATASATSDAPTRIELLLDTVADQVAGHRPAHRPRFHTFETLRPPIEADAKSVWDRVVDLHSLVLGWYADRSLFHKIGYLVASRRASFHELVTMADGSARSTFEAALDALISQSLDLPWSGVTALTYQQAKKASRVLLLMNVETVRLQEHSTERYSFSAHARRLWSLEHIHAQQSEGLNTIEAWRAWLLEHREALDVLAPPAEDLASLRARIDAAIPTISGETFEPLHREIVQLFSERSGDGGPAEADREDVDSIANLALLARDDNSALNNAVFEVKRRFVIGLDQQGSYIPVCTRNVFLKYYDTGAASQHIHFWGARDREAYLAAMKSLLEPYLLEDTPDNDHVDDEDIDDLTTGEDAA